MKIDIGIEEKDRHELAEGLSKLLADSYTLYLKTHNFHWNVVGPLFSTLHGLFETQYRELAEAVDRIAERIRAIGFPAPATYSDFARLASVKETPGVPPAERMIELLVQGHEATCRTARQLLGAAERTGDQPTIDLIADRMNIHEKSAWMLRSHLEGQLIQPVKQTGSAA